MPTGPSATDSGKLRVTKSRRQHAVRARPTGQRMELTPAHLEVVRFLQSYASEHDSVPNAQELANVMAQHFENKGGRNYLLRLFPKGPVTQASKLAGLELAKD